MNQCHVSSRLRIFSVFTIVILLFCLQLQQSVGLYFALTQTINKPGKSVKIVAYPKWRFSCIVLYDVQVNFCCIQSNVTTVVFLYVD